MKALRISLAIAISLYSCAYGFNDQDADGLSDELEIEYGLDPTKSSYFPDSDGDGFADHIELFYKSDPSNRISHPPFGTPFGITGINPSDYWNTVDMWAQGGNSGSWILLLGDGSVVTDITHYTPIRPIVKVAGPDPWVSPNAYFGIQADGKLFPLGASRDSMLESITRLPYRLPIEPDDQVISLGHRYGFALANRYTNKIQVFSFDSNPGNIDLLHIFSAPETTVLQADEQWLLARNSDGNVFLLDNGGQLKRFDIDMSWATHVYISRSDLIAISGSGRVLRLPAWEDFLNDNLEQDYPEKNELETTPFSTIPDYNFEFAAVRTYGDDIIAVLIEGAWIFRLQPGSDWQNIGRFNFTGILDAATTEINFTDSQAILSYFDPNSGNNGSMKFRTVSLVSIGLVDNSSPATSVPSEFVELSQLSQARRLVGNHDDIIFENYEWQNDAEYQSVFGGNGDIPYSPNGLILYSPSGWGLSIGNDYDDTGISDAWEAVYSSHPLGYGIQGTDLDSDGDGIEDAIESIIGLDFESTDSNGDGIPDKVDFFQNFPRYFGSPEQLNPYLRASLLSDTFLTSETAEIAGFINESEAITTTIIQPDISLGANTIFMEWSVMESDDLMNWEQTDSFIIEKELSNGKQFFRVLMSE